MFQLHRCVYVAPPDVGARSLRRPLEASSIKNVRVAARADYGG